MQLACCLLAAAVFGRAALAENNVVAIQTKKPVHEVSDLFLSLSVDPEIFIQHDFNSDEMKRIRAMARSYAPAYLRLAGPWCQMYHFESHADINYADPYKITGETVEAVDQFLRDTGLNLILCLNPTLRNKNGSWNMTEARNLLELAHVMDMKIAVELGFERMKNEPSTSGTQMGMDLLALSNLLEEFPRFQKAPILAPDITSLNYEERLKFSDMVQKAGSKINAVTWHTGTQKIPEKGVECQTVGAMALLDATDLASRRRYIFEEMSSLKIAHKPLWIGDGKMPKAQERFVDGMVWTSRLGEVARIGAELIMQTPSLPAILNTTTAFWVSALHRDLVGRRVLDTRFASAQISRQAHIFTHCSRSANSTGGITVFGVNYGKEPLVTELYGLESSEIRKFELTAGPDGPFSKSVLLNGKTPSLSNSEWLQPETQPASNKSTIVIMPPESIVFWEIPTAMAEGCLPNKVHKREVEMEAQKEEEAGCWWREGDTLLEINPSPPECFSKMREEEFLRAEEERDQYANPEEHYFARGKSSESSEFSDESEETESDFYLTYRNTFQFGPGGLRRVKRSAEEEKEKVEKEANIDPVKETEGPLYHKMGCRSPIEPCFCPAVNAAKTRLRIAEAAGKARGGGKVFRAKGAARGAGLRTVGLAQAAAARAAGRQASGLALAAKTAGARAAGLAEARAAGLAGARVAGFTGAKVAGLADARAAGLAQAAAARAAGLQAAGLAGAQAEGLLLAATGKTAGGRALGLAEARAAGLAQGAATRAAGWHAAGLARAQAAGLAEAHAAGAQDAGLAGLREVGVAGGKLAGLKAAGLAKAQATGVLGGKAASAQAATLVEAKGNFLRTLAATRSAVVRGSNSMRASALSTNIRSAAASNTAAAWRANAAAARNSPPGLAKLTTSNLVAANGQAAGHLFLQQRIADDVVEKDLLASQVAAVERSGFPVEFKAQKIAALKEKFKDRMQARRKALFAEKRVIKAKTLAASGIGYRKARKETSEYERYEDAWPKPREESKHKVTARKDFEEKSLEQKKDDSERREIDLSPMTTQKTAAEAAVRAKRAIGESLSKHHIDDLDFIVVERNKINDADWSDIPRKIQEEKIAVSLDEFQGSSTTTESAAKSTTAFAEEGDDSGRGGLDLIFRKMMFIPIMRGAETMFCGVKRLFIPSTDCTFAHGTIFKQ